MLTELERPRWAELEEAHQQPQAPALQFDPQPDRLPPAVTESTNQAPQSAALPLLLYSRRNPRVSETRWESGLVSGPEVLERVTQRYKIWRAGNAFFVKPKGSKAWAVGAEIFWEGRASSRVAALEAAQVKAAAEEIKLPAIA